MSQNNVVLLGYSGHGMVVAEAAIQSGLNLIGYSDKTESKNNLLRLKYLGDDNNQDSDIWKNGFQYILGIGNNQLRVEVAKRARNKGATVLKVIHPTAQISNHINIEDGTFIGKGAIVNIAVSIQRDAIINTGVIVEHECKIGFGAHLAPGVVLAGNVSIGAYSFVGANSVIRQGVTVGKNSIIGAGAVVICDIPDNQTWVGNPAKRIK